MRIYFNGKIGSPSIPIKLPTCISFNIEIIAMCIFYTEHMHRLFQCMQFHIKLEDHKIFLGELYELDNSNIVQ